MAGQSLASAMFCGSVDLKNQETGMATLDSDVNDTVCSTIDAAIIKMAEQVRSQPHGPNSQSCAQAALNLAHAKVLLSGIKTDNATPAMARASK